MFMLCVLAILFVCNIDKMFGQHCAVLGSTGSGKSASVASILHSVLDHKIGEAEACPNIVIIDPHGEYSAAFNEKAEVFKAYNAVGQEKTSA